MTSASAIRTEGLSKKFLVDFGTDKKQGRSSLLDFVSHPLKLLKSVNGSGHLWALKNLSIEIKRGECVALMGPNGAGKSTLLKLISRISEPSSGRIDVWGSIGSLLETGVGFHPELSGRENIFLSGAILGLNQKKIKESFDEIVDFSGIEKFIEEPVRTYSSGMKARLGFSVMAIQPHDTLLLDEVLTVGDIAFRHKCKRKIKELKREGRTLVVVSHNLDATNDLCNSAIYISSGELKMHSTMAEVLPVYLNDAFEATEAAIAAAKTQDSEISIFDARVIPPDAASNSPLQFRLKCVTGEKFGRRKIRCGIRIRDDEENLVASGISYTQISALSSREFTSIVSIPNLPLSAGFYKAQIRLYEEINDTLEELDRHNIRSSFLVLSNPKAPAWLRNSDLRGVVINEIDFDEVQR